MWFLTDLDAVAVKFACQFVKVLILEFCQNGFEYLSIAAVTVSVYNNKYTCVR